MYEENILPVIGKLKLVTVEHMALGWQTQVYDGNLCVETYYSDTKKEAKRAAVKWCLENYIVPKRYKALTAKEIGL